MSPTIGTYRPTDMAASRMRLIVCACSSCVPCEKFRRKTSTPCVSRLSMTSSLLQAGPRVAMILVRLNFILSAAKDLARVYPERSEGSGSIYPGHSEASVEQPGRLIQRAALVAYECAAPLLILRRSAPQDRLGLRLGCSARPNTLAIASHSRTTCANVSGRIACGPSDSASSGLWWTSTS